MQPSPENHEKLERAVHQALRELPVRRAPRSLETRVLAELERRAALPWWKKSFVHWPLAARAAFLVLSAGVMKAALMGTVWVMAGFDAAQFRAAFAPPAAWLHNALAVVSALGDFFEILLRNIPAGWLYGGAAFLAVLYVALFGLGAVAYRTLYASR